MTDRIPVARLDDLADEVPTAAQAEGVELVLLRRGSRVSVFQGSCPHQGASLAGGSVQEGALVCAGHGWRFDAVTGEKLAPARACLKRFDAEVERGEVRVAREELRAWAAAAAPAPVPAGGRPLHDLPGPRGLPLLGNLAQLQTPRLHAVLEGWADRYGDLYRFSLGRRPVLVTSRPALIHEVMRRRPDTYRRLGTIAPVLDEMGADGVFSAEGERWKRQRPVASHALNARHLRGFFPVLAEVTGRLLARWRRAAAEGRALDVQEELKRFTVDVTTRLAFGYDMNTLERDDDALHRSLEQLFPTLSRRITAPFPYWHFVKLPADRAFDGALATIRETVSTLIAESRARLAADPTLAGRPTNFIEAMLSAGGQDGAAFGEEEILGNALTMLVAGEDTTATSIAWMMYFLAERPEVLAGVAREADAVLGDEPLLRRHEDHERLTYLAAVAQETMRLKPIAPMLFFENNHAVELGGVHLPAGTAVFTLTRQAGLQESAFSAAREFRPERWLEAAPQEPGTFSPFGGGPRFCPGRSLAMLEIASVVSMLCRNFTPSRVDPEPVAERFAFTMMPDRLRMRLTPRG